MQNAQLYQDAEGTILACQEGDRVALVKPEELNEILVQRDEEKRPGVTMQTWVPTVVRSRWPY